MYELEKHLQNSISMWNEIITRYENNIRLIDYCEKARIDLLHQLRDHKHDAVKLVKIARLLKQNEEERHAAKDENQVLKSAYDVCIADVATRNRMQKALGDSRKVMNMMQNRTYNPRTNIFDKLN
jgi:hypothetical protein